MHGPVEYPQLVVIDCVIFDCVVHHLALEPVHYLDLHSTTSSATLSCAHQKAAKTNLFKVHHHTTPSTTRDVGNFVGLHDDLEAVDGRQQWKFEVDTCSV